MNQRPCPICGQHFMIFEDAVNALYCSTECEKQAEQWQMLLVYTTQVRPLSPLAWRELLLEPQLGHFLLRMVWRQGNAEFMVCEDYTFATVEYRPYVLTDEPVASVTELSAAWREVFWDYELIPLPTHYPNKEIVAWVGKLQQRWLLAHLLHAPSHQVRMALAENPALTSDQQAHLAQDWDFKVRQALAGSSHTPPTLLTQLATDRDFTVRDAVAKNRHTPVPTLQVLLQDRSSTIRQAVVKNPQFPVDLLAGLVHNPDAKIRKALLNRPQLPLVWLELFTHDPDPTIATQANLRWKHYKPR